MTDRSHLKKQWAEWSARPFPRGEDQLGDCDIAELASLDSFLAGYASQTLDGAILVAADLRAFQVGLGKLKHLLPQLPPLGQLYFEALFTLGSSALELQQSRSERDGHEG